jgi:hypothetical protein
MGVPPDRKIIPPELGKLKYKDERIQLTPSINSALSYQKQVFKMKKLILFFTFCLMATLTFSQGKVDKENIVIGKIDSVQSNILGENRKIWVYVPDGAANSKERFPVVYVLDGDGHFSSVVGVTQQLSTINGNTMCPKMIIVGIPNTDRTRDLTPNEGSRKKLEELEGDKK